MRLPRPNGKAKAHSLHYVVHTIAVTHPAPNNNEEPGMSSSG